MTEIYIQDSMPLVIEPDEWEVDYSSVAFEKVIGSGEFGTVSRATVSGLNGHPAHVETTVAVKKLKRKSADVALKHDSGFSTRNRGGGGGLGL